jgi:hypothetical protein
VYVDGKLCFTSCFIHTHGDNQNKNSAKLSLDVGLIPWTECLKFWNYNPGKIKNCGILIGMLCEAKTGHISNKEMYKTQGKKLKEKSVKRLSTTHYSYHVHIEKKDRKTNK